jgi:hypothetical protein
MNEPTVFETTIRGTQGIMSSVSKIESLNLLSWNADRHRIFTKIWASSSAVWKAE